MGEGRWKWFLGDLIKSRISPWRYFWFCLQPRDENSELSGWLDPGLTPLMFLKTWITNTKPFEFKFRTYDWLWVWPQANCFPILGQSLLYKMERLDQIISLWSLMFFCPLFSLFLKLGLRLEFSSTKSSGLCSWELPGVTQKRNTGLQELSMYLSYIFWQGVNRVKRLIIQKPKLWLGEFESSRKNWCQRVEGCISPSHNYFLASKRNWPLGQDKLVGSGLCRPTIEW